MGILTLIVVVVVVLAVIGLGVGAFYSGVLKGAEKVENDQTVQDAAAKAKELAEKVGDNPIVENATEKAKELADSAAKTVEDTLANKP